jgi:hypothetical protein
VNDPTSISGPLGEEIRARRAAQGIRAERARYGQLVRELGNTCQECGPAGAGGGDAGEHPGYVPVTHEIVNRRTGEVELDSRTGQAKTVTEWRPCFTCNPERWRAWQEGKLHSTSQPKIESAADRQARDQDRQQRERSSFA